MIQLKPFPTPTDAPNASSAPDCEAGVGAEGHVVQFYEGEDFLVERVTGFVSEGLKQDEAVIVIATAEHLMALRQMLRLAGIQPDAALLPGRLITLDAAETLAGFMVDGRPDAQRFDDTVGELVRRVGSGGRRVRAFGEMVAMLLEQGRTQATLALEALWNELIDRLPIQLLCAYPMHAFRGCEEAVFIQICRAHARVVPAESFSAVEDDEARARVVSLLQLRATRG